MTSFAYEFNRPFPRCRKPLFYNEVKCKTFLVKMIFYYHANKTNFHKKGFALNLVLRARVFGTRKWPILQCVNPANEVCSKKKKRDFVLLELGF